MSLEQIDQLILSQFGLATRVMGPRALDRAVRRRLDALHLTSDQLDTYVAALRSSSTERQELLELLVVPETWFFRNERVFPYLARYVMQEWLPANPVGRLRVLSLACATGEEPYSILMALRDAGLPLDRISLEAVDISERALAIAGVGIYGRNSFRSFADRDVTPIAHHLANVGQGLWQVRADLRSALKIRQGNLHDRSLPASLGHSRYDIVLCRNVMIYFPREGQQTVLNMLFGLLGDQSRLFVGHSELIQFIDTRYVSTGVPMTFSFRKRTLVDRPADPAMAASSGSTGGSNSVTAPGASWNELLTATPAAGAISLEEWKPYVPPVAAPMPVAPVAIATSRTTAAVTTAATASSPPLLTLADARRAADRGHLDQAHAMATEWLSRNPPTADAMCLLGVIHDARGDGDEAERSLRRAIYLDPRHYEGLVHLALLLERNGDPAAAAFRRRALRVSRANTTNPTEATQ